MLCLTSIDHYVDANHALVFLIQSPFAALNRQEFVNRVRGELQIDGLEYTISIDELHNQMRPVDAGSAFWIQAKRIRRKTLSVRSFGKIEGPDKRTVFSVLSPIGCPRNLVHKNFGDKIEVDGVMYRLHGIEMAMVLSRLEIGEEIWLLVGELKENDVKPNCSSPSPHSRFGLPMLLSHKQDQQVSQACVATSG